MVRRRWSIAQVFLFGALIALALPSSGSAFAGYGIVLTASGPSPTVARMPALMYPVWINPDTVTHTVTFADGCSFDVAPSSRTSGKCHDSWAGVGSHAYTVDGTFQASLNVIPEWRSVTIKAKRHRFHRGSRVRLHGRLEAAFPAPTIFGPRMPVTLYARRHGQRLWHKIAIVTATPLKKPRSRPYSVWHFWVRPHGGTTYMAKAESEPKYWKNATAGPFGLYVPRRWYRDVAGR